MKGLILTLILPILSPLCLFADDTATALSLVESVNDINKLKNEVSQVGTIERPCPSCDGDPLFNLSMKMDKEEIDLDNKVFFIKDLKPINVVLQRDENSPEKMTIAFKNPYRICGKHYVGPSLVPGGALMIDCIYYTTKYEDQEIDLDLSKFPKPAPGESQSIVISLTKKDITKTKYTVDTFFNGKGSPSIKIDKKFFGGGHNVVIRKPSSEE